jgi:hypothetical protein
MISIRQLNEAINLLWILSLKLQLPLVTFKIITENGVIDKFVDVKADERIFRLVE